MEIFSLIRRFCITVLIVVAVVCWFVLMKLKAGLQLRAIGENPRAAQACGINVILYRHIAVMLAGFLSGIGGAYLVVATMGSFVEEMSAGRGFIAMAVSTLCHWNPILALIASFVFGIAQGLQMRMQAYGINIPYQFLLMLPYGTDHCQYGSVWQRCKSTESTWDCVRKRGKIKGSYKIYYITRGGTYYEKTFHYKNGRNGYGRIDGF